MKRSRMLVSRNSMWPRAAVEVRGHGLRADDDGVGLRVGDGAVTAAGSVITEDVPAGALALGRARQVTKPGLGARLMQALRAAALSRGAR